MDDKYFTTLGIAFLVFLVVFSFIIMLPEILYGNNNQDQQIEIIQQQYEDLESKYNNLYNLIKEK